MNTRQLRNRLLSAGDELTKAKGRLIIIGGHEEKSPDQERTILKEVAHHAAKSRLVVLTAATNDPEEVYAEYRDLFRSLGVQHVAQVDVRTRNDGYDEKNLRKLADGSVVFMTGGDQLRITSQLGDCDVFKRMYELYHAGSTIAGTSAGAAAMPETMLAAGADDESIRIEGLDMAPGLGLQRGVVIDSHFAERGRMGRLLGAVAHNPRNIGLGIDEDTAVIVENSPDAKRFRVIGTGAVYVVDGTHISHSSLSDRNPEGVLTICGVTVHVLGKGDEYDLTGREPLPTLEHVQGLKGESDGNGHANGHSNGHGDGTRRGHTRRRGTGNNGQGRGGTKQKKSAAGKNGG